MNFKQLEQKFINEMASLYDVEELKSLFYIIIEHFEGWDRSHILLNKKKEIDPSQIEIYENILSALKNGKPLQYIFAETSFFGLKFKVNSAVLIPRPETEELVNWVLETVNADSLKTTSILDIGTGSGCIAVILKKKLKDIQVTALDVSKDALLVAAENAQLNAADITFINGNILDYKSADNYDLIVSNPPYIKENERAKMHPNVLAYEPHLALFVSNEKPLIFYEVIADFALLHLNPEGKLFFEINEYLGKATIDMLRFKGFNNIILKKDMQGKDRMIYCRL